AEAPPVRVGGEHARAVGEGQPGDHEAAELDQVSPAGEPDEQRAPPCPIVVEEDEAVADQADVRRHEIAVHESGPVEACDLGPERTEKGALRPPLATSSRERREQILALDIAGDQQTRPPLAGGSDNLWRRQAGTTERLAHPEGTHRAPASRGAV